MAGEHGYDPLGMPEMKAFFLAAGPDIRNGATLQSFENVDLYPLIAQILGLPVGKIDGDAKPLQSILKNQKPN
jgi:alkaline phosphatase D